MKRRRNRADFSRLRRRILLQTMGMVLGSIAVIVLFYLLVWAGRGADFTVAVLQKLFGLSYQAALGVYTAVFRNNAEVIMTGLVVVVLVVFLVFFLTWFTRYFSQINDGIDELLREEEGEITLRPELNAIERKLNAVRQNLRTRALETQLAEKRKNDLVMYLAHDIRTPLTSVIGYLSLLDEAPDMPAEQRAKYVHITLDKALRLETLVNEFFEITRYNLQHIALQKEQIDLYYMLVQLLDEFYPILSQRGSAATLVASEALSVFADAAQLARVFTNLLKNAVSYSRPGTNVVVTAEVREGAVAVAFQNTGRTIPPEKLAVIFDKFYRLDTARTSDTGGAGLGLSIAREIVTAHGGAILAESENEQTIFTVLLPLGAPGATAQLPARPAGQTLMQP